MVHKQAFHTTAKCVGVVSLVKSSQTCPVVEIFISDVQNKSATTSIKLLALISIGEIGRRRWAGTCGWAHLLVVHVVWESLTTCFSILSVVPCTVE